jgi:hypothetical protein
MPFDSSSRRRLGLHPADFLEDLGQRRAGDVGGDVGVEGPQRVVRVERHARAGRIGIALGLADVGGDARAERAAEQRIGHALRDVRVGARGAASND